MSSETFSEITIQALKNPTRAAIFFQLARKPNSTTTEIAKRLGEDFDVVHYHIKQLRKMKLVSKPKIVVRKNYIEKQYSLRPDFKEELLRSQKQMIEKEKDLCPEDSRDLIIAFFSVVRSILTESTKRLSKAPDFVINKIMKEDLCDARIMFCSEDDYLNLLKNLRKVLTHSIKAKTFDPTEKHYAIAFVAIPKLD